MLFVVSLPEAARASRDYSWSLKHGEFGFTTRFRDQPQAGDTVLLCSGVKGGRAKAINHILLATALGAPYDPDKRIPPVNLSWPSEVAEQKRTYIRRLPVSFFGEHEDNDASKLAPLFDALRRSARTSTPRKVDASDDELDTIASNFGCATWEDLQRAKASGLGDPQRAREALVRAEEAAINHYRANGWDVVRVGRPHNLLCTRDDEEKRIEVKCGEVNRGEVNRGEVNRGEVQREGNGFSGTRAADAHSSIRLSADELASARQYPTDLVVVAGETLNILENWHPLDHDLTPTEFEYRLP